MSKKGNQPSIKTFFSGPPAPSAAAVMDRAREENVELQSFQAVFDFIKQTPGLVANISEFVKLIRFILTIPVSTCTAERTFSSLRRLKTYLRFTMSQQRLNHLAILNCHGPIAENLNLNAIIDEFILKNDVRKNTFAL